MSWKSCIINALSRCLPEGIKKSMMHLSYHLASDEFTRFAHVYCLAPNMQCGLETIAARGFEPKTIIDVGAYEGGWSVAARAIWPQSKSILIEPNYEKRGKLEKLVRELDGDLYFDLLGAQDGSNVTFNVMETVSSIMCENSPVERTVEKRTLSTLDSLPADIESPTLLKIDAQGYELEILRGATRTLSKCEGVLLEIAIIEINVGAPLLHEVVAFMKKIGFIASEVLEIHRRPLDRALSQIDVLFVREGSRLLEDRRFTTISSAAAPRKPR